MDGAQLDQSQTVIKKPKVVQVSVSIESSNSASIIQSKIEPGKSPETVTCKTSAGSGAGRSKQNTESATTPEEIALAIDHIRETIFSPLDKKTLFNCRPVCHRWQYFASKQLQISTTLRFTEERWWMHEYDEPTLKQNQQPEFVFNRNCRRTVQDLAKLMTNSIVANTEFPCTSFEFNCAGKISPVLELLFQIHGTQLKKLEFFRDTSFHCFQGLKNILVHATNLEYFAHHPGANTSSVVRPGIGSKSVSSSDEDDDNDSEDDEEDDVVQEYNEEGEEIAQQVQQLPNIPPKVDLIPNPNPNLLKVNLKVIKFTHKISRSIFQEFVDNSPNLTEVSLVTENLEFLLKPVNRLHLLKTLKTEIKADNIEALESLATAIHTQNNGKSAIEHLDLDLLTLKDTLDLGGLGVLVSPDMLGRIGKVYTQILAGSSASCKRLKWYPTRYFDGFQIPVTSMPNVTTLELVWSCRNDVRRGRVVRPTQFFHDRISLEDVFPNLKYVSIQSKVSCFSVPITNLFDNFNLRPVLTVTKVTSALVRCGNYLECFQDMFPNAVITEGLRLA